MFPGAEPPTPETPRLGAQGRPTSGDVGDHTDHLRVAIDAIQMYLEEETDEEDLAEGSKIQATIQGLLAKQQKLVDTATGAGPGARLVRKATAAGGGGGY